MAAVFVSMSFIWTDLPELSQVRPDFVTFVGMSSVAPTLQYEPEAPSPVSLSPKGLSKLGCGLEGQTADKVLADRC